MNNKKKIAKYMIALSTSTLIAAAVISAAVGCSSNNYSSNANKKDSTNNLISVNGTTYNKNAVVNVAYGEQVTLSANNKSIANKNIIYKWYKNGQLLQNVKSNKLIVSSEAKKDQYYCQIDANGVQTVSNTITINPTFKSSSFKAVILQQTNNNTVINDINNTTSYPLRFEILYNNVPFTLQPTIVHWTINGKQLLQTNPSLIPNLVMGTNNISAVVENLPTFFGLNKNSLTANLTINYAQIQITTPNLKNNELSVNYDSTVSLQAVPSSLQTLVNAGINLSNVSYQWYENDKPIKDKTTPDLTLKITTNATYYLKTTYIINNQMYSLTSNSITISPIIPNQIKANITSTNNKVVTNTLNIYNESQQTQELTLSFSNVNTSNLTGLNVEWLVNKKIVQSGTSLSFNHTYNIGTNNVTVNVTYTLDGKTITLTDIASFIINYYSLNIETNSSSISYGSNVDTLSMSYEQDSVYENALYQWEINGQLVGNKSNIRPTTLPSYNIQQTTTFNLVVTNSSDLSDQTITSNSITITPTNTSSISAILNTKYGSNNTLNVYSNVTGTTPSSYKFNVQLEQDEKQYSGTLNNVTTTWTLTFNDKTINSTQTSTLSIDLPISDLTQSGTYTLVSSTKLVGISTAITASYTINYSQLTISSNTDGSNGTLSINQSNFGSLINQPYFFWQVEGSNNSWTTVSSNNNSSSSYDVSNLTSSKTYRVIVANANSLSNASIKLYSNTIQVSPTELSDLSYDTNGYAQWFLQEQLNTWIGQNDSYWNNFISQYAVGYQLDANYSYFDNCQVYFSQLPNNDNFNNQQFLTIRAVSIKPISIKTWQGDSFQIDNSINAIPAGSVFTWTLPYELSSLTYSNNTVSIPILNDSEWLDTNTGEQTIATPFGLSIGTLSNPTSISGSKEFSQAVNNVIEISYGDSANSPYTPPSSLSNAYTGNTISPTSFNNTNNTLYLNEPNTVSFNITNNLYNANYSITISNSSNDIVFSNSIQSASNTSFNYCFYTPGIYTITISYTFNNANGTKTTKSQKYYVNYSSVSINATTTNPKLGTTDVLNASNNEIFNKSTNITYQWFQIQNGIKNKIVGANSSSYTVNINQYNATYEYQLQENINGVNYLSAPIILTPDLTNFVGSSNISNTNSSNNETISTSNFNKQSFNLTLNCYGTLYNSTNASNLNDLNITWYVNNEAQTNTNQWVFNYMPTANGNYQIKALIKYSLYGQEFSVYSNTINLNVQNESIIQALNNAIKNPITLPNSYAYTAAQSLNSSNVQNTIQAIKNAIISEIFQNQNSVTLGKQTFNKQQLMQELIIKLPANVSYQDNLNGILQNIEISYGNEQNIQAQAKAKLNSIINSKSELANIIMNYFEVNPSLLLSWIQCWGLGYKIASNVNAANFNQYFSIDSCSFNETSNDFLGISLTIKKPVAIAQCNNEATYENNIGYIQPNTILNITTPFQINDFSASLSVYGNSINTNIWQYIEPFSSQWKFITSEQAGSDSYYIGWTLTGSNLPSQYKSGTFVYTNFFEVNQSMCIINLTNNNTNNALQNFNTGININNSTYEVIGFLKADADDATQEEDVASTLGSILGNEISLNPMYSLTAQASLSSLTNQTALINTIEQTIASILSNLYSNKEFVINNIAYSISQIISSLNITLPSNVSWNNNENGILQNVTIAYNDYSVTNSNGIDFEVTNFNTTTKALTTSENETINQLLEAIINNNTIALINYHLSVKQSLLSTNKNELSDAIKNTIIDELKQSSFILNNIYFDLSQIISIINNLTINLPNNVSQTDENSGIINNVTFSYNNQTLNNEYTITNLTKVNNLTNSNTLNISFKNSSYDINEVDGITLNNFSIQPEISDWQDTYTLNYYINIASENVSNFNIASYQEVTPFTFSNELINLIQNNPSYIANKYLVITLFASISDSNNSNLTSCSTKIIINNNKLFLYAISNNQSFINLNCYTNQTYSLFFDNYLTNSTNTYQLVEIVNQIKTTKTITYANQKAIKSLLLNQVANSGIITYYLQEINNNNEVLSVSNEVTINCSQIGGITLTNQNINDNVLNVNLSTTSSVTLNIIKNDPNVTFYADDIYYQIAANNNEWLPITRFSNLFKVNFTDNEITFSHLASDISINVKIVNTMNNLYSNVVTIKTNAPSSMWNSFTYNNKQFTVAANANQSSTTLTVNVNAPFQLTFNEPKINLSNIQYNWSILTNSGFESENDNLNSITTSFSKNTTYIIRLQISWMNNYSAQAYTYLFKVNAAVSATKVALAQQELNQFCSSETNELNVIKAYWNNNPSTLLPWIFTPSLGGEALSPSLKPNNFYEYFSIQSVQIANNDDGLIQAVLNCLKPMNIVLNNYGGGQLETIGSTSAGEQVIITTPYQLSLFKHVVQTTGASLMYENITSLVVNSSTFNNTSNNNYQIGWNIPALDANGNIDFSDLSGTYEMIITNLNSNNTLPNYINVAPSITHEMIWNMKTSSQIVINYTRSAGYYITFDPFFYPLNVSDVTYTWYEVKGNNVNQTNLNNGTEITTTSSPQLAIAYNYETTDITLTYYCICTYEANGIYYTSHSPNVLVIFTNATGGINN